jgi:hypothetical protein
MQNLNALFSERKMKMSARTAGREALRPAITPRIYPKTGSGGLPKYFCDNEIIWDTFITSFPNYESRLFKSL